MSFGVFTIVYTNGQQQMIELRKSVLHLGRGARNDIQLGDDRVSAQHARVTCSPQGCEIVDLGSSNGTFLGGVKLTPYVAHPLADGDELQIGDVQLTYVTLAGAAAPRPVARSSAPDIPQAGGAASTPAQLRRLSAAMTIDAPIPLVVEPGGAGSARVTIANTGTVVDRYTVKVHGLYDPGWVSTSPDEVKLLPKTDGEITLLFRPPRSPEARADRGKITVLVKSAEAEAGMASKDLEIEIKPFLTWSLEVRPQRVEHQREACYKVLIRNEGNRPESFRLNVAEDSDRLAFVWEKPGEATEPIVRLNPGAGKQLRFRAIPKQRLRAGSRATYNITLTGDIDVDHPLRLPTQKQQLQFTHYRGKLSRSTKFGIVLLLLCTACSGGGIALWQSGLVSKYAVEAWKACMNGPSDDACGYAALPDRLWDRLRPQPTPPAGQE